MPVLTINREKRIGYSARKVAVYLDGKITENISNGGAFRIFVDQGQHTINFAIGSSVVTMVVVTVGPDTRDISISCTVETNGAVSVRIIGCEYQIAERNTVGKSINNAMIGTVAVIFTLIMILFVLGYILKIAIFL